MAVTLSPAQLKDLGYRKDGNKIVRATENTSTVRLKNQPTYALGDETPYKSKAEAAYAGRLQVLQRGGQVCDWRYESVTLRLADRVRFTPDFWVQDGEGRVELHEVKGGFVRDDARVKLQVAATMYPEYRFVLAQCVKGSWTLSPVRAL